MRTKPGQELRGGHSVHRSVGPCTSLELLVHVTCSLPRPAGTSRPPARVLADASPLLTCRATVLCPPPPPPQVSALLVRKLILGTVLIVVGFFFVELRDRHFEDKAPVALLGAFDLTPLYSSAFNMSVIQFEVGGVSSHAQNLRSNRSTTRSARRLDRATHSVLARRRRTREGDEGARRIDRRRIHPIALNIRLIALSIRHIALDTLSRLLGCVRIDAQVFIEQHSYKLLWLGVRTERCFFEELDGAWGTTDFGNETLFTLAMSSKDRYEEQVNECQAQAADDADYLTIDYNPWGGTGERENKR
eukprot:1195884-Prorocentrum_minimum.AAC.2